MGKGVGAWRRGVGGQVRILQSKKKREKVNGRERFGGSVWRKVSLCSREALPRFSFAVWQSADSLWISVPRGLPWPQRALSEGLLIWGAACILWLTDKCYKGLPIFAHWWTTITNSLQHFQLSCWKVCQAYIKDECLPLLPLPYKSVNHNKYLASQTVSASASGEPGLYQENFERTDDKTGFRARSLTAQTGDKDSISGAQIISVINFHW